jgi:hypothetical protein
MNPPHSNRVEAKEFLRWRYGDRPAQVVYGDRWKAEEVAPDDTDALLERVGDGRFYFAPCDLRPGWGNTTPGVVDAIASRFVWFDFDAEKFGDKDTPPSDESKLHYAKESARIGSTLKAAWEKLGVYPSAEWFSGGGVQGLFRLDRAIAPERAEALCKKLAIALGSDPTVSNRNRVLRVPGGVNPKDEYGRRPTTTSLFYKNDSVTKVEDLEAALARIDVPEKEPPKSAEMEVNWALVPAQDLSWLQNLPADFPPKVRIILDHEGTLGELNETLKEQGLLQKGYGSWNSVTFALAALLKHCNLGPEMMAAVLMAPLPCNKHVHNCKDKHRTVERALNRSHEPKAPADSANWPDGTSEFGIANNTYGNCLAAITKLGTEFWQDVFRGKPFVRGTEISDDLSGEVSDAAVSALRHAVYKRFHFHPTKETMVEAVGVACRANKVNPVLNYYAGLPPWDGVPRIDTLFVKYLGAEDTKLNQAFGRKFMCAKVRRAKQPGCKWDHIPVLEGKQGKRKSMFCEDLAVAPDLFTDTSVLAGTAKEQMEVMAGKDVIELGEMAGLHQTTRSRIKAFITRKRDRARMAYDRYAIDVERRGVCIGTSNPSKYLSDSTGERRWWPVAMTKYDRDEFLRDKDQLYAEAVAKEPTENIWLDTKELETAHAQLVGTRKEPNELVDLLSDLRGELFDLNPKGPSIVEERVSSDAVRKHVGMNDADVLRIKGIGSLIADAMAHLGWTKADKTLVCAKKAAPTRAYYRPYVASPPTQPEEATPREQEPQALGPVPKEKAEPEIPF